MKGSLWFLLCWHAVASRISRNVGSTITTDVSNRTALAVQRVNASSAAAVNGSTNATVSQWYVGKWSECRPYNGASCGDGVQYRAVECPEGVCDGSRPSSRRPCNKPCNAVAANAAGARDARERKSAEPPAWRWGSMRRRPPFGEGVRTPWLVLTALLILLVVLLVCCLSRRGDDVIWDCLFGTRRQLVTKPDPLIVSRAPLYAPCQVDQTAEMDALRAVTEAGNTLRAGGRDVEWMPQMSSRLRMAAQQSPAVLQIMRAFGWQGGASDGTFPEALSLQEVDAIGGEIEALMVAQRAGLPPPEVQVIRQPIVEVVEKFVERSVIEPVDVMVPKIEYVEKFVEVTEVEYRERIVEVPQFVNVVKEVEVPEVQEIVREVPKEEYVVKKVEVPGEVVFIPVIEEQLEVVEKWHDVTVPRMKQVGKTQYQDQWGRRTDRDGNLMPENAPDEEDEEEEQEEDQAPPQADPASATQPPVLLYYPPGGPQAGQFGSQFGGQSSGQFGGQFGGQYVSNGLDSNAVWDGPLDGALPGPPEVMAYAQRRNSARGGDMMNPGGYAPPPPNASPGWIPPAPPRALGPPRDAWQAGSGVNDTAMPPPSDPTIPNADAAPRFPPGTRVVVQGRAGTVAWNGLPINEVVKVLWDDDKTESGFIPLDRLVYERGVIGASLASLFGYQ
mmetsp:Transcript_36726/g.88262  ORF Transcript_36726/g.88262 Transcript_36726/m.88262 type:complete len:671 (-) Transcript_36726:2-2014(-)